MFVPLVQGKPFTGTNSITPHSASGKMLHAARGVKNFQLKIQAVQPSGFLTKLFRGPKDIRATTYSKPQSNTAKDSTRHKVKKCWYHVRKIEIACYISYYLIDLHRPKLLSSHAHWSMYLNVILFISLLQSSVQEHNHSSSSIACTTQAVQIP